MVPDRRIGRPPPRSLGREVEVGAIDLSTAFRGFDDYWSPFL